RQRRNLRDTCRPRSALSGPGNADRPPEHTVASRSTPHPHHRRGGCAPRRNRLDQSPPTANTPRLSGIRPSPTPPRGGSSPPAPAPTALHHGDRPTQPNSSGRPSTPATTIQPCTQPTAP